MTGNLAEMRDGAVIQVASAGGTLLIHTASAHNVINNGYEQSAFVVMNGLTTTIGMKEGDPYQKVGRGRTVSKAVLTSSTSPRIQDF